ncbi:hypothetical protein LGN11_26285 [Burkholderia multivorans]|nr:hypothetical protein [Burkholderia multivorans]
MNDQQHSRADALTDERIEAVANLYCLDFANGIDWCFDDSGLKALVRSLISESVEQHEAAPIDGTLAFESALSELVNKIDSGLDTGDLLADARMASAALDVILSRGDLVANAHDFFKSAPGRYEDSVEFRIGWNACLDAIERARASTPKRQRNSSSPRAKS